LLLMFFLSVLLLAVAVFALGNAQAVTVRFLYWQLQSSVAVVTLAATVAGVLIAGLAWLVSRLRRWRRGGAGTGSPLHSGHRHMGDGVRAADEAHLVLREKQKSWGIWA